ncbi:MAG: hypothetical protein L0Y54_17630 [Sporichthyaceae bacterium]|nr:hypothetical protein [Sporichthyaceae bacterium]
MHTLGHPTESGHGGSPGRADVVAGQVVVPSHDVAMTTADLSVAGMAGVVQASIGAVVTRLHPLAVCVAVLVAGLLALLAGLWAAAHGRRGGAAGSLGGTRAVWGRGPPHPPSYGLVLADLSVQRR